MRPMFVTTGQWKTIALLLYMPLQALNPSTNSPEDLYAVIHLRCKQSACSMSLPSLAEFVPLSLPPFCAPTAQPENILLNNATSGEIKLIDFGSACFEHRTVYSYIQSR